MQAVDDVRVESESISDFARVMPQSASLLPRSGLESRSGKLNLNSESVKNGLGQLVLAVVKLLHELLERQALRRVASGSLSDEQIERLGLTLMQQSEELERLRKEFGLDEEDLNLDLGPLGKLF